MKTFIKNLPKAELHLHIEGSLEPEMMFEKAKKNGIKIPYKNITEVQKAYEFTNLQDFLDIYYAGARVLISQEDFYDLTYAYMKKCHEQNIVHTEIFFDPQTHTSRGIKFKTVLMGIKTALEDAKIEFGISSCIIMCFLRHLSEEEALDTFFQALPFKEDIMGIGLDSSEIGHPPRKFKQVFEKAKEAGFKLVAHAGEEAGVEYIVEALNVLGIERIDHGVQAMNSQGLMQRLKKSQIPLTVCPHSNIELKVFDSMKEHNVKAMLEYGLNITLNSDDPAYFKGYLNENFISVYESLHLQKKQLIQLAKNSFEASFISSKAKKKYLKQLDEYVASHENRA